MLTKKEIQELFNKQDSSLKIVKPTVTPKSSTVWNSFSCIYVTDVKQEYVICNQCHDLLIYKPSSGTNSLFRHIRSCQNIKTPLSGTQSSINQFYGIGFKNLAQKIFNAGRCLPMSQEMNIEHLLPHPTTVRKTILNLL